MFKVAGFAMTAFASSASAQQTLENEALLEMLEMTQQQTGHVDAVFSHKNAAKAEYFQQLMALAANPNKRKMKRPALKQGTDADADADDYADEEGDWEWVECEEDDDSPDCQYYDEEMDTVIEDEDAERKREEEEAAEEKKREEEEAKAKEEEWKTECKHKHHCKKLKEG